MAAPNPKKNQAQSPSPAASAASTLARAAPDVAPPPMAEQRLATERDACVASLADCDTRLAAAAASRDGAAIIDLGEEIARIQQRIGEIESALTGVRFVPSHDAAIDGALASGALVPPQGHGRIQIATIYDLATGKRIESKVVTMASIAERRARPSAPRAGSGSLDPRLPGAGWSRDVSSHGVTFRVAMLGGNSCRAEAFGHAPVSGSVGTVVNQICQGVRNAYAVLGLGEPGETWSDASPRDHWTRA